MALWLVRAGKYGEYEKRFIDENRIYLTWGGLSHDLGALKSRGQLRALLEKVYADAPKGRITNNLGQIWAFSHGIASGDWIILPSKQKPAIHVAEVKGDYTFDPEGDDPFLSLPGSRMVRSGCATYQLRPRPALFLRRVHDHLPGEPQRRREAGPYDGEERMEVI